MVRFGSVGIVFRSHRCIFTVRYFCGSTGCRFFQLVNINRIGTVDTVRHVSDDLVIGIEAVIRHIGLSAYSQPGIVDDRITGRYAFEAFQGFGETDFQVVVAVGYDAEIVIVRQLGCIRNAADDVHLFVQFLFDDVSCIAAVFHAVI